jgi:hypothetical protein
MAKAARKEASAAAATGDAPRGGRATSCLIALHFVHAKQFAFAGGRGTPAADTTQKFFVVLSMDRVGFGGACRKVPAAAAYMLYSLRRRMGHLLWTVAAILELSYPYVGRLGRVCCYQRGRTQARSLSDRVRAPLLQTPSAFLIPFSG